MRGHWCKEAKDVGRGKWVEILPDCLQSYRINVEMVGSRSRHLRSDYIHKCIGVHANVMSDYKKTGLLTVTAITSLTC